MLLDLVEETASDQLLEYKLLFWEEPYFRAEKSMNDLSTSSLHMQEN